MYSGLRRARAPPRRPCPRGPSGRCAPTRRPGRYRKVSSTARPIADPIRPGQAEDRVVAPFTLNTLRALRCLTGATASDRVGPRAGRGSARSRRSAAKCASARPSPPALSDRRGCVIRRDGGADASILSGDRQTGRPSRWGPQGRRRDRTVSAAVVRMPRCARRLDHAGQTRGSREWRDARPRRRVK